VGSVLVIRPVIVIRIALRLTRNCARVIVCVPTLVSAQIIWRRRFVLRPQKLACGETMRSQHFDRRLYLAHEDGASPTPLSVSRAPGESGVSVLRLRFPGDAYYGATLRQHFIRFQMSPQVRLERPLVWGAVRRDVTVGSLAIYPAGIECGVEVKESVDALIVAIDPDRLALAAAESSALGARLTERLSGYDEALFDLAHNLALEGAADRLSEWSALLERCREQLH
jgi:hypothetical protein